jgi:hypothetical protein
MRCQVCNHIRLVFSIRNSICQFRSLVLAKSLSQTHARSLARRSRVGSGEEGYPSVCLCARICVCVCVRVYVCYGKEQSFPRPFEVFGSGVLSIPKL